MKRILLLLIMTMLYHSSSMAQIYIEPIAGYAFDLNNAKGFNQLNTALQVAVKCAKIYDIGIVIQKTWTGGVKSVDPAYTANSSFPLYSDARKTIKNDIVAVAFMQRLYIYGRKHSGSLNLVFNAGGMLQRVKVKYKYDKEHYTILQADKSQTAVGPFIGGGLEYMKPVGKGRLFFQALMHSEPVAERLTYPSSFRFSTMLLLNAGYSISLKK